MSRLPRRRALPVVDDSSSSDGSDVEEVSPPKIQKQNPSCSKSTISLARRKGRPGESYECGRSNESTSGNSVKIEEKLDDDPSTQTDLRKDVNVENDANNEIRKDKNDVDRNDNDADRNDNDAEKDSELDEKKPEIKVQLTDAQRAKIERNRQKALLLRQARLAKMPTGGGGEEGFAGGKKDEKMTRVVDSGGGFLIEEEIGGEEEPEKKETITKQPGAILQDHLPDTDESKLTCEECEKPFSDSYLLNHFDCNVCDACRDNEEKHRLITKTDAKNEYLLKDEDFFIREPPLKYILKKNPHNSRWGDMKLFLHCQVHDRAMAIYGTEDALEEKHDQRDEARQKMRQKKFDKKVKELRRKVRSSLYTKNLGGHEHEFGEEEEYDSDKDEYSKKCKTCDHVITYEKM